MMISSFKTVLRNRENNARKWILILVAVFCVNASVTAGARICAFMFLRLQYNVTTVDYGNLASVYFISSSIFQLTVIPFLTNKLKIRDTTILILAFLTSVPSWMVEAFADDIRILYFNRLFCYPLWANLYTTMKSAISKLIEPNEVAKAFSLLAVIESGLSLVFRPLYGLFYRETVNIFPGLWILVSGGIFIIACSLTIFVHIGTRKSDIHASGEERSR